MAICVNCGVEIDDALTTCPLCGKNPREYSLKAESSFSYPSGIVSLHRKEIRRSLWELSCIIAFSVIAVCSVVNLIFEKRLTWSLLSDATMVGVWIILTLILHFYKRTIVIIPGLVLTILADMYLIDLITGGRDWFFEAGLPIVISVITAVIIIILLYKIANFKGLNIIAAALVVISGFCVLTEMILDWYNKGLIDLRWSLIVAVSVFPVASLLLFYHYRLKKGDMLERYLHI
jgi:hypothetical protein